MIYVMTAGEYSDYGIEGIYEGPDGLDLEALKTFVQERMNTIGQQAQQIDAQAVGMQRQIAQLEGAADDCLFWMRQYTLPTFSQEGIVGLDDRSHPALEVGPQEPKALPTVDVAGDIKTETVAA